MLVPKLTRTTPIYCLLFLIVGATFAGMAWMSLARYDAYTTGMLDLGNMSQAVWSGTQGKPLVYTDGDRPKSRLSWHAEIFYFLLVPIYRFFPSPVSLLVFQSALFAAGCIPLFLFARRKLKSPGWALVVTIIYLFYPVAQTAVLYDFHGDTLAMPLLLFAVEALDRRAWWSSAIWVALALSCKVYVAVPVATLGLVLWKKGEARVGKIMITAALAWFLALLVIVRPYFALPSTVEPAGTGAAYLQMYFGQLSGVLASSVPRLLTGLIVFGPALLLGLRAWLWLLPGLVIAVPGLLSTGPGPSYLYAYHHYALVVPFAIAAIVYGARDFRKMSEVSARDRASRGRSWQGDLALTMVITVLLSVVFVNTPLNPRFYSAPTGQRLEAAGYGVSSRDRLKDAWLKANVPPHVPIAASTMLAAHLTDRETLLTAYYSPESLARISSAVDYFVLDAFFEAGYGSSMEVEVETIENLLKDPRFSLLSAEDGLLLFGRNGDGLLQRAEYIELPEGKQPIANFDNGIALADFGVTPLGNRRYRFRYDWSRLESIPPLFAVTEFRGIDQAKFLDLPSYIFLSTSSRNTLKTVREEFDVELPDDLEKGTYELYVAWYDSTSKFAAESDYRSRVGKQIQVGSIAVY
jgi:uncharacterized membrane protein